MVYMFSITEEINNLFLQIILLFLLLLFFQ